MNSNGCRIKSGLHAIVRLKLFTTDNLPYEQIGKNEPVCIADDVPFEIPDNWAWIRLESDQARKSPRPLRWQIL